MGFFSGLGLDVAHFGPLWHIFKVGQLMATDLNRISGQYGLSIADFHLLGALMIARPEPLRATDLALRLNVSNAVLCGRVRKLADDGLLLREMQPGDRRAVLLHLTDDGAARVEIIGRALEHEARFIRYHRQLPEADQQALARIMGDLHNLMDRDFLPVTRSCPDE